MQYWADLLARSHIESPACRHVGRSAIKLRVVRPLLHLAQTGSTCQQVVSPTRPCYSMSFVTVADVC